MNNGPERLTETGRLTEELVGVAEANRRELEIARKAAMGDDIRSLILVFG